MPSSLSTRECLNRELEGTLVPASLPTISPDRLTRLTAGLARFREALIDASESGHDQWEFALTLREALAASLTGTDLRWLVTHGLIQHAREETSTDQGTRVFQPVQGRMFTEQSCCVLTDAGRRFAEQLAAPQRSESCLHVLGATSLETALPKWDAQTRELTWGDCLIKRFRTPAGSQEVILRAFQAAHWASRIADPLEQIVGVNSGRRLRDAIRRLNGRQHNCRIHFCCDGTGQGVCWEGTTADTATAN